MGNWEPVHISNLTWKEHVKRQINTITSLWACRRAFENTRGFNPRILMWCAVLPQKELRNLDYLQRLVGLGVTRALLPLVGLPPIYMLVGAEATEMACRLMTADRWLAESAFTDHARIKQLVETIYQPSLDRSDRMFPAFFFKRYYQKISFEGWSKRQSSVVLSRRSIWFTNLEEIRTRGHAHTVRAHVWKSVPFKPTVRFFRQRSLQLLLVSKRTLPNGSRRLGDTQLNLHG